MLQNLHLNISPRLQTSSKHGRRPNDDDAGSFGGGHVADKVVEGFEDAGVFVGGFDEGVAFFGEHGLGACDVGIDEGDDFEAGAEFAV